MTQLVNTYGGIGSRTNLYADEKFLSHATPKQILERYALTKPLPRNKTLTISFRRSIPFDVDTTPLQEGVTPTTASIHVLKHGDRLAQEVDEHGLRVVTAPADLLRDVHIVDHWVMCSIWVQDMRLPDGT